jgi:hypothetical protein
MAHQYINVHQPSITGVIQKTLRWEQLIRFHLSRSQIFGYVEFIFGKALNRTLFFRASFQFRSYVYPAASPHYAPSRFNSFNAESLPKD